MRTFASQIATCPPLPRMKPSALFAAAIFFCTSLPLKAQSQESPRGAFWHTGFGRALLWADNLLNDWEHAGLDTAYVQVPRYDRQVYLGTYGYWQQYELEVPTQATPFPTHLNMHHLQSEIELGIDWRGLAIEIPIPISNPYSQSWGLAKTGSQWGARFRYKSTHKLSGTLEQPILESPTSGLAVDGSSATDVAPATYGGSVADGGSTNNLGSVSDISSSTSTPLQPDQCDLKTLYVEGYYGFNSRKFCLAAALYGDMIQRRSAGGFFLMGQYFQSRLGLNAPDSNRRDIFRNNKVSLGAGYGYNLSLLHGKLCFHASIIPMVSLLNNLTHKSYPVSNEHSSNLPSPYEAAVAPRHSALTFNAFARLGASAHLTDRFVLAFFFNYRTLFYSNSSDLTIRNRDFGTQLNFGYCF